MNLTLETLRIGRDERAAVVGQTGTGKSFLSSNALLPKSRVAPLAIIDPKRMFEFDSSIRVFESAVKLIRAKPDRFVYRPTPNDLGNMNAYNEVYAYCYNKGNIMVYTDDMVGVMNRTRYPRYLQVCYQMGRQKNVSMLSAFQRPAHVPLFLLTESSKFYVFRLNLKDDVKRVGEFVSGYDPSSLPSRYSFAYFDVYGARETCEICRIGSN